MTWKCMTHSRSPNNEELAGQRSRERRRRAEVASLVAAKRSDEDQQHHYDWGETTTLRRKWVIAQKAWRCYDALISSFLSCILPGLDARTQSEGKEGNDVVISLWGKRIWFINSLARCNREETFYSRLMIIMHQHWWTSSQYSPSAEQT